MAPERPEPSIGSGVYRVWATVSSGLEAFGVDPLFVESFDLGSPDLARSGVCTRRGSNSLKPLPGPQRSANSRHTQCASRL